MASEGDAKKALRKSIFEKRDALSFDERQKLSNRAKKKLLSLPEFERAATVLFFVSFRSEINTMGMIEKTIALGKKVAVPRTDPKARRLLLSLISKPENDLIPGYCGIPEPMPGGPLLSPKEVDVVVAPGAAFDRKGRRMGYGGGYYDRLIRELRPDARTLGLAFSFQVVPEVPTDPKWDMPVHLVVTDKEVIRCC